MTESNFYQQIYSVVKQIPQGKVTSYGRIASMLGAAGAARQVGYAMSALRYKADDPQYYDIPWQRVINSQGKISIKGSRFNKLKQAELLRDDGVEVSEDLSVDLEKYLWEGMSWQEIEKLGAD